MGRPRLPTKAEQATIRTFLNLAPNQPWPRCPGKSRRKVRAFVKAGDTSHSAKDHICDECRCDNPAGFNTGTEDLYGIGVNCGHFGTGYCGACRPSKRKASADKAWQDHIKALQATGASGMTTTDIEKRVVDDGNRALATIEANEAIKRVREALEAFDTATQLDPDNWITAKGGKDMDDETRAELVMKKNKLMLDHAKTIDQLRRTEFEMSRELHVPLETMKIWVVKIMQLGQRYCPTRDDYESFVKGLQKIVADTKNHNMMMAEHEVQVEQMPRDANG